MNTNYDFFIFPAADRSISDSVSDAKEGLVVSCADTIETYRTHVSNHFDLFVYVFAPLENTYVVLRA